MQFLQHGAGLSRFGIVYRTADPKDPGYPETFLVQGQDTRISPPKKNRLEHYRDRDP
jgi:hypothetical protein